MCNVECTIYSFVCSEIGHARIFPNHVGGKVALEREYFVHLKSNIVH